ncbi:hypothetical protein [Flavobacterium collinsii]|uniref:Uncharacterized protein n=1 Tax=Flavobacterium collinsii TaxID=1114861 RepID=A0A9W4TG15_9FLAO|nr:hypothetical protein [Flavobacterium collinsii]CAI2766370.1 conserved protein of unknown function [Flavobacterium collinsii]
MQKILLGAVLLFTIYSCENGSNDSKKIKEEKITLQTNVIDAEYSKKTDQLVYVSSNPSQVNIFNSSTESLQKISLAYTPTCISISQNGNTAVVGHDGHITHLNLKNPSIIQTYDISCSALDIVLGNNRWAYVFPEKDQWTYIKSVNMNLEYNYEMPRSIYNQISAGTKGRLHPSGKYIYSQSPLSRAKVQRLTIKKGDIDDQYESNFEEENYTIPSIWFSEDGNRLFTRERSVLKTSELNNLDAVYNGKIPSESNYKIDWLDHSSSKGKLYVIFSNDDKWNPIKSNNIYVFNDSDLSYVNKFDLEKYFNQTKKNSVETYDAVPYFVFSNSTGNRLFVVTKALDSDLVNKWAIQKIDIN